MPLCLDEARETVGDFDAVKDLITIAAVQPLLSIMATKRQQRGLRRYTAHAFSANRHDNVWHCFKCGRYGNALDL